MIWSEDDLRKRYKAAPPYIQDFIKSDALFDAFQEIQKAHKLHIDQAGNLSNALNMVILGITPFDDFPSLLKEALGQHDSVLDPIIATEVNTKIFIPLREITRTESQKTPQKVQVPTPQPQRTDGIHQVQKPTTPAPVPTPVVSQENTHAVPSPKVVAPQVTLLQPEPQVPQITPISSPPKTPLAEVKLEATTSTKPVPQVVPPEAEGGQIKQANTYKGVDPYREQF